MKRIVIFATAGALALVFAAALYLHLKTASETGAGRTSDDNSQSAASAGAGRSSGAALSSRDSGLTNVRDGIHGSAGRGAAGAGSSVKGGRLTGRTRADSDSGSATNAAGAALTPSILKQRAMKQLFAAASRGSVRAMWQALSDAGVTLSYEDYLRYVKDAKNHGTALDRVGGAWDQLLQFWARKDPAAALAWAQANQLHTGYSGPDEIFFRMVAAWGGENPEAAAAFAMGVPGFAETTRGKDVLSDLNGMTNRMSRLELLATPAATLTPEQKRDMAMATAALYGIPDSQVPDVAKWLLANRAIIDPSMWERAMGAIASRMTEVPVFDLIALVQSLPTTPGAQSVRSGLLSAIASRDPQTALSLTGDRDSDRMSVLQQWSQDSPADALRWVLNLSDAKTSAPYLGIVVNNLDRLMRFPPIEGMAFPDSSTIMQTLDRLRAAGSPAYSQACEWAARSFLATDVNRAFELAARSSSPTAMENLLGEWVRIDPAATLAWVNSRNDSATYAAAMKSVFPQVVRRDLDAAIAWSRQLQDRTLWLETVKELLPLTPYERWNEVLGSSPTAFRQPDVAGAAMSGAVRLGFNDFEGSCIAVDEVMRRMGLGETETERQANWAQQPASVIAAFEDSQRELLRHLSYNDPQGTLVWAEQWPWVYTNGAPSVSALQSAYSRWSSDGSGRAQDWLNASRFTEAQRQAIASPQTFAAPATTISTTNRVLRIATPGGAFGR